MDFFAGSREKKMLRVVLALAQAQGQTELEIKEEKKKIDDAKQDPEEPPPMHMSVHMSCVDMYMTQRPVFLQEYPSDVPAARTTVAKQILQNRGKCVLLVYPLGTRMNHEIVLIADEVKRLSPRSKICTQTTIQNKRTDQGLFGEAETGEDIRFFFVENPFFLREEENANTSLIRASVMARTTIVLNWSHPRLFDPNYGIGILEEATNYDWSRIVWIVPSITDIMEPGRPEPAITFDGTDSRFEIYADDKSNTQKWIQTVWDKYQAEEPELYVQGGALTAPYAVTINELIEADNLFPHVYGNPDEDKKTILFADNNDEQSMSHLHALLYATYSHQVHFVLQHKRIWQLIEPAYQVFHAIRTHRIDFQRELLEAWHKIRNQNWNESQLTNLMTDASLAAVPSDLEDRIVLLPENIHSPIFMLRWIQYQQRMYGKQRVFLLLEPGLLNADLHIRFRRTLQNSIVLEREKNLHEEVEMALIKQKSNPDLKIHIFAPVSRITPSLLVHSYKVYYTFYTNDFREMIPARFQGMRQFLRMQVIQLTHGMFHAMPSPSIAIMNVELMQSSGWIDDQWLTCLNPSLLLDRLSPQVFFGRWSSKIPPQESVICITRNETDIHTGSIPVRFEQITVAAWESKLRSSHHEEKKWILISDAGPESVDLFQIADIIAYYRTCQIVLNVHASQYDRVHMVLLDALTRFSPETQREIEAVTISGSEQKSDSPHGDDSKIDELSLFSPLLMMDSIVRRYDAYTGSTLLPVTSAIRMHLNDTVLLVYPLGVRMDLLLALIAWYTHRKTRSQILTTRTVVVDTEVREIQTAMQALGLSTDGIAFYTVSRVLDIPAANDEIASTFLFLPSPFFLDQKFKFLMEMKNTTRMIGWDHPLAWGHGLRRLKYFLPSFDKSVPILVEDNKLMEKKKVVVFSQVPESYSKWIALRLDGKPTTLEEYIQKTLDAVAAVQKKLDPPANTAPVTFFTPSSIHAILKNYKNITTIEIMYPERMYVQSIQQILSDESGLPTTSVYVYIPVDAPREDFDPFAYYSIPVDAVWMSIPFTAKNMQDAYQVASEWTQTNMNKIRTTFPRAIRVRSQ